MSEQIMWADVVEVLPSQNQEKLVKTSSGEQIYAILSNNTWKTTRELDGKQRILRDVTHWKL